MKFIMLSRAKAAGNNHCCASGEAVEEEHHDVHNHGGRTHGSQRLGTHKVAHHNGINSVIKHLEYISQHQWKRKSNKLHNNGTLGHIAGGGIMVLQVHKMPKSFLFRFFLFFYYSRLVFRVNKNSAEEESPAE